MSPSESAILAAKAACWDARASLGSRRDAHRDRGERGSAQCVRLALAAVARAQRALDAAARALEAADACHPERARKETGCASGLKTSLAVEPGEGIEEPAGGQP